MKDTEMRLVAELMKNSRRSDRELAKAIGVSQPTVSRLIKKLETQGIVREYTAIPDYNKLGFQIAAFTFVSLKPGLGKKQMEEARKTSLEMMRTGPPEIVLFERGISQRGVAGQSVVVVSFHDSYSSYTELREMMKRYTFLDLTSVESFLIDLNDEVHFRYLTFSTLANHLVSKLE